MVSSIIGHTRPPSQSSSFAAKLCCFRRSSKMKAIPFQAGHTGRRAGCVDDRTGRGLRTVMDKRAARACPSNLRRLGRPMRENLSPRVLSKKRKKHPRGTQVTFIFSYALSLSANFSSTAPKLALLVYSNTSTSMHDLCRQLFLSVSAFSGYSISIFSDRKISLLSGTRDFGSSGGAKFSSSLTALRKARRVHCPLATSV